MQRRVGEVVEVRGALVGDDGELVSAGGMPVDVDDVGDGHAGEAGNLTNVATEGFRGCGGAGGGG